MDNQRAAFLQQMGISCWRPVTETSAALTCYVDESSLANVNAKHLLEAICHALNFQQAEVEVQALADNDELNPEVIEGVKAIVFSPTVKSNNPSMIVVPYTLASLLSSPKQKKAAYNAVWCFYNGVS